MIQQRVWGAWRQPAVWAPVLVALVAGLACLAYTAAQGEGFSFPLDDAWIHQTYARNLAHSGQWAFIVGQPSAGSTAPLWTVVLALGYAFGLDGIVWSHALGIALLAGAGLAAGRLAARVFPGQARLPLVVGVLVAAEWHLVWAAVSGMETLLFVVLALMLSVRALDVEADGPRAALELGLLGGLLTLTRPEGSVLFALWLGWRALRPGVSLARRVSTAGLALVVCGVCLAPMLAFNFALNGTPFPNTFAAKQTEYRALLELPLWQRGASLLLATLVGPGLLAVVGAPLAWRGIVRAAESWYVRAGRLLPALWVLVFIGVYAWRLPVTYQHARYVMPAIPFLLVYAAGGLEDAALWVGRYARLLQFAVRVFAALITLAFVGTAVRAYHADVRVINRTLVTAALWVDTHTAPGTLVATHDIGALGYFAGRPLVDLAGLASPEVVPLMGDAAAIAAYVERRGAEYLVAGLGFEYPAISGVPGAVQVFSATWDGGVPDTAGDAMASEGVRVYRLR